jgi:hypothetical protein
MSIRGSASHQKAQRYKYSKNNHFRRENKDLLKNFSKLERASQSTVGVNPLRRWAHDRFADSTNLDVSPEGLLPQGHVANVVCLRSGSLHEASLAPWPED